MTMTTKHTQTHTHSLSYTQTLSLSLSLTHTHTHTHTHSLTHSLTNTKHKNTYIHQSYYMTSHLSPVTFAAKPTQLPTTTHNTHRPAEPIYRKLSQLTASCSLSGPRTILQARSNGGTARQHEPAVTRLCACAAGCQRGRASCQCSVRWGWWLATRDR